MAESQEDQVARLLGEGLERYGDDQIAPAIKAWREVLGIDPGNAEALDYLQTADRREQRALPAAEQMSDTTRGIVHEARVMMERADWEAALDLLRSRTDSETVALEFEGIVEIVRSRLLRQYSERVGRLEDIPAVIGDPDDLTRYNLPPDAGFVLSLIDGTTPVSDLISLSGMDPFEALRIIGNLLDADILQMAGK